MARTTDRDSATLLKVYEQFRSNCSLPCFAKTLDSKYIGVSSSFVKLFDMESKADILDKTNEAIIGNIETCERLTSCEEMLIDDIKSSNEAGTSLSDMPFGAALQVATSAITSTSISESNSAIAKATNSSEDLAEESSFRVLVGEVRGKKKLAANPNLKEKYISFSFKIVVNNKNKPIGFIGHCQDNTLSYNAKRRYLRQAEMFLRLPDKAYSCAFIDVTSWEMLRFTVHKKGTEGPVIEVFISIDEFIARSDRMVSDDLTAHKFFANLNQKALLDVYESGVPSVKAEFFIPADHSNRVTNRPADDIREIDDTPTSLWVEFSYFFLLNPDNNHVCILLSVLDINSQKIERENLVRAAEQDLMTGLLNHETSIKKADEYANGEGRGLTSALFIIDVDNFKLVNDRFGHRTGDNVLIDIAQRIRSAFRDTDIIGRIGGDEFFVLMKNVDRPLNVRQKAFELVESLQYECRRDGLFLDLTSSIGIKIFRGGEDEIEDLYTAADKALYRAKNSGKNRVEIEGMDSEALLHSSNDLDDEFRVPENSVSNNTINLKAVLSGMNGVLLLIDVIGNNLNVMFASNSRYGQNFVDMLPAEEYDKILKEMRLSIANKTEFDYILHLKTPVFDHEWIQLKGSQLQSDISGIHRMIVIATDISIYKNVENQLRLENAKRNLALSITNVIVWEYDIISKNITEHDSGVSSPFISNDMVYPESYAEYMEMYNAIDEGAKEGTEEIHFKSLFGNEKYDCWMQVSFVTLFDEGGHVKGALFAANDISEYRKSVDEYDRIRSSYAAAKAKKQTAFHLNLTNNLVNNVSYSDDYIRPRVEIKTATGFINHFLSLCDCDDARRMELVRTLNFDNLMQCIENKQELIEEEVPFFLSSGDTEWFLIRVFIIRNPETEDAEAFCYLRNINQSRISQMIVDRVFEYEYEFIGVIDTKVASMRVIQQKYSPIGSETHFTDYEQMLKDIMPGYIVENELLEVQQKMSLENIITQLKQKPVVTLTCSAYDMADGGKVRRKKYQYTYLDDTKRYISVTKSDINAQYQSEFDLISGLLNRSTFYRRARALIDSQPRTTFVIIRWDIDKFKLFNDLYGSQAGDELLAMIGNAYRELITPNCVIGNLGADNFALCMPINEFDVNAHIEWLQDLFENLYENYNLTFHMAGYQVLDTDVEVGHMCDRALIAVKSIKENLEERFAWYDDSMRDEFITEQALIDELRSALDNDQFDIYIQPQFNQFNNTLVSGEVLVRWIHPEMGVISPGNFIPTMEKTGMITKLDQVIWEKACKYLSNRIKAKKKVVPLALNISRHDFFNPRLCDIILNLVHKYRLSPKLVELEVTESIYMEDTTLIISVINRLHENGFTIKMDDFGSGYSSLNILKDVPVDMLKLDLKFLSISNHGDSRHKVNNSTNNAASRGGIILDSVMRMAHWLNLPVIAEGVETKAQADFLKSIDCAIVQGYYFSKPLAVREFSSLLDKNDTSFMPSDFVVNEHFQAADFWSPDSPSSNMFSSFVGAAGIFEFNAKERSLIAIRVNDSFEKEVTSMETHLNWSTINLLDLVVDEEREELIDTLANKLDTETDAIITNRWYSMSRSGRFTWTRLRMKRIARATYHDILYASVENITNIKEAEITQQIVAQSLESIANYINDGVLTLMLATDDSLPLMFCNRHLTELLGYDYLNFVEEYSDDIRPLIKKEDLDKFASLASSLDSGEVSISLKLGSNNYSEFTLSKLDTSEVGEITFIVK